MSQLDLEVLFWALGSPEVRRSTVVKRGFEHLLETPDRPSRCTAGLPPLSQQQSIGAPVRNVNFRIQHKQSVTRFCGVVCVAVCETPAWSRRREFRNKVLLVATFRSRLPDPVTNRVSPVPTSFDSPSTCTAQDRCQRGVRVAPVLSKSTHDIAANH